MKKADDVGLDEVELEIGGASCLFESEGDKLTRVGEYFGERFKVVTVAKSNAKLAKLRTACREVRRKSGKMIPMVVVVNLRPDEVKNLQRFAEGREGW